MASRREIGYRGSGRVEVVAIPETAKTPKGCANLQRVSLRSTRGLALGSRDRRGRGVAAFTRVVTA
jgi:hypothetical protein